MAKARAEAASHDVRPGEAAWLRDQTLAMNLLVTTPTGGDTTRAPQWDCADAME